MLIGFSEKQRDFCRQNGYECDVTQADDIVGYALETQGNLPVNGLRHVPEGSTSGWYIWCGPKYSTDSEFFSPLHAVHLERKSPEIIQLLGLPPGYRFLLAGEYLDVWYDQALLIIDD